MTEIDLSQLLRDHLKVINETLDKQLETLGRIGGCLEQLEAIVQGFGLLLDKTSRRLIEQGIQEMLDEEIERQKRARQPTPGGVPRKVFQ